MSIGIEGLCRSIIALTLILLKARTGTEPFRGCLNDKIRPGLVLLPHIEGNKSPGVDALRMSVDTGTPQYNESKCRCGNKHHQAVNNWSHGHHIVFENIRSDQQGHGAIL